MSAAPPNFGPGDLVTSIRDFSRPSPRGEPPPRKGEVFVVRAIFTGNTRIGVQYYVKAEGRRWGMNAKHFRKLETKPLAFWTGESRPVDDRREVEA